MSKFHVEFSGESASIRGVVAVDMSFEQLTQVAIKTIELMHRKVGTVDPETMADAAQHIRQRTVRMFNQTIRQRKGKNVEFLTIDALTDPQTKN